MDFTGLCDFTIHNVATNHTIGILHVPDSLATTALGDFLIHTVTLLITDSLINPQSDNGSRASFPCCVVTLFTDCLAAVVTQLACCLMSRLPVLLGNAARVVYCSLATSVLRLGSFWLYSLRLCSARCRETLQGRGAYQAMRNDASGGT
jgi:hypothetical protein